MRPHHVLAVAALAGAALFLAAARGPQEAKQEPPAGLDPATMMEAMKLAQPGPEHEILAKYAGEWDMETSITMMPGMPAQKGKGKATSRMILGNRFLEIVSKGELMGEAVESVVILGYDRRNETWNSVGLDTMGTYWVTASGKQGEDGKLRLHGEDVEPVGKTVFTNEVELVSDDEWVLSVWFSQMGPMKFPEPFKIVEVRYTRKKS